MQYYQYEFHEAVSRDRTDSQAARIPPPPSCSPPRFTPLRGNNKHYVLSEVELATFRTQLCESHQRNRCAHPDACPHSHCLTWQRRNPYEIIYDPHLCPGIEFRRNNCKMSLIRHCTRGRSCAYAHSKEEELYHPLMYKTKPCTVFPKCDRHYCPFSHSTEEMRQPFNNPLIQYIWGTPAVDCNDSTDMVHRWALPPFAALVGPLIAQGNTHLASLDRDAVHGQTLQLQQPQLQLQQQQQQIAQPRWPQGSYQPTQHQNTEHLHSAASPAIPPTSVFSLSMQQRHQPQDQQSVYVVGPAKHISTPEVAQQALPRYTTKQNVLFPSSAKAIQQFHKPNQKRSHLRQSAEMLQPLEPPEEVPGNEARRRTSKGRKPPIAEGSLLGRPLSVEKGLHPSRGGSLIGAVRGGSRAPVPSDTTSSTTTTVSTDLQDLLDSESLRRALIMTLAQQLIGPEVSQLSVDQVLIVLDLAVKLAPHLQPSAPNTAFLCPPPDGLLQLHQTDSDSPRHSSTIITNTVTQAPSAAVSQEEKSTGASTSKSALQRDHTRDSTQQQGVNEASAASAARDPRGAPCVARPTTTDDLLGDSTSPLFDPQLQDPAASLAATHMLIEQLRKLSLLNVCEEGSRSCSSPAPSLEEVETSSLSIVRGSSTAVWSTSTSPMVGAVGDLSSRCVNLSSRHVDLVPTTAITAAATTFAVAPSSADEASLSVCPSLTIAQDISAGSDKHDHRPPPQVGAAADDGTAGEGSACAASGFPRRARGKVCASPVEAEFRPHVGRHVSRGGSAGVNTGCATTEGATKSTPRFPPVCGSSESFSPQLRGLLPPPGAHKRTGSSGHEVLDNHSPASCVLPLTKQDKTRHFRDGAEASHAAGASLPPPPPQLQLQQGICGRSQVSAATQDSKQQQDACLQKSASLAGTLAVARKMSEPFSPQLTTCSHSPSAGHFSSPQCCTGRGSSAEPTPACSIRLSDGNSSTRHSLSDTNKGSSQAGSRSAAHESRIACSEAQCRQHAKAEGPQASA